jgi:hypothetical protein
LRAQPEFHAPWLAAAERLRTGGRFRGATQRDLFPRYQTLFSFRRSLTTSKGGIALSLLGRLEPRSGVAKPPLTLTLTQNNQKTSPLLDRLKLPQVASETPLM